MRREGPAPWRKWGFDILFIAVTAAVGTALFVAVIVLVNDLRLTGNAADWLATLCNVVMAVTAVRAFIVARSWLPQLTTQEGYKQVITLVNEDVLALDNKNPFRQNVQDVVAEFIRLNDKERLISGESVLHKLQTAYVGMDSKVSNINKLLKKMETYGLESPEPQGSL